MNNHQRTLKTISIILTLWHTTEYYLWLNHDGNDHSWLKYFGNLITGKEDRKRESANWRKSLFNKSCSQKHIQVLEYLTISNKSNNNHQVQHIQEFPIISNKFNILPYHHCIYKHRHYRHNYQCKFWHVQDSVIITILKTGWKVENMDARLTTLKARDFPVLLHWLFNVSFICIFKNFEEKKALKSLNRKYNLLHA